MRYVQVFVRGFPRPQPRPRATAMEYEPGKWRGRVGDTKGKRCGPWRKSVAAQLRAAGLTHLGAGPVCVELRFVLPRPKSHYGTGRNADRLKASAPTHPIARAGEYRGDVENLAKAVLDEMQGPLFEDDSQVVELLTTKRYARAGEDPGVLVVASEATEDPLVRPVRAEQEGDRL